MYTGYTIRDICLITVEWENDFSNAERNSSQSQKHFKSTQKNCF